MRLGEFEYNGVINKHLRDDYGRKRDQTNPE